MNHVTKKLKEDLSRSVQQVKTRVVKYPVVIPVVVVIAMLPYVASRIFKATIVRRQTCEIEDSVQEVDIIEFLAITDSWVGLEFPWTQFWGKVTPPKECPNAKKKLWFE